MQATRPSPLVVVAVPAPMAMGLVTRVAPPGGHVTGGASQRGRACPATRRPLRREAVPGVTCVAALQPEAFVSAVPAWARRPHAAAATAQRLGVHRSSVAVDAPDAREGAVAAMTRAGAEALVRCDAPLGTTPRRRLLELAVPPQMPGLDAARGSVEAGGLVAAHVSTADRLRRAASDVERLLTGATPGDLPVEPPTTGTLGITLKTAEALGLPLPPPLRVLAAAGSRCAARPKAPRARDVGPLNPSTSVDTIRGPTPPGPGAPRPQGRVRLTCPGRHPREAPSWSPRGGRPRPTPGRPGLLHHHRCLGRPGDQRGLERCHPGAVQAPHADGAHVLVGPLVAAVIRGAHPRRTRGPSRLAGHPQPHRRLGVSRFPLAVIALPGATALVVSGPRAHGRRAVAGEVRGRSRRPRAGPKPGTGSGGSRAPA